MLIPQFTIRSILILTAIVAVIAWVISRGAVGIAWAQCVAWTLGFIVLLFFMYALFFGAAMVLASIVGQRGLGVRTSTPFAAPRASEFELPAE